MNMKNILIALLLSANLFATEIGQHNIDKYIYINPTNKSKYIVKREYEMRNYGNTEVYYKLIDEDKKEVMLEYDLKNMLDYLLEHNFKIYRERKVLVDIPEYNTNNKGGLKCK